MTSPLFGVFVTLITCSPVSVSVGAVTQRVWVPDGPHTCVASAGEGGTIGITIATVNKSAVGTTRDRSFMRFPFPPRVVSTGVPRDRGFQRLHREA